MLFDRSWKVLQISYLNLSDWMKQLAAIELKPNWVGSAIFVSASFKFISDQTVDCISTDSKDKK